MVECEEGIQEWGATDVCDAMRLVADLLGPNWIERKIQEEEKARRDDQQRIDDRKHSYLFRKDAHPLIQWWILTQAWLNSASPDHASVPESAYRLVEMASAFASARTAGGFEKLIPRLKRESEFFSAAFEAVVAASYLKRAYRVEFVVEDSQSKSPDLKVTLPNDSVFWVECKCRDEVIERDKAIRSFWQSLQAALMRKLGPRKINAMIAIKCIGEPQRKELDALTDFVMGRLRDTPPLNMFKEPVKISPIIEASGKYQVAAQVIAPPDEEVVVDEFGVNASEEFDYSTTGAECRPLENGGFIIKNPYHFAFKTDRPTDGVPGVLNAFKSAVGQLPADGPGVVWLKVADGSWGQNFDGFMGRVAQELRRELSGQHNRRVNAAIVHVRGFDREPLRGGSPIYRSAQLLVEHVNPRNRAHP